MTKKHLGKEEEAEQNEGTGIGEEIPELRAKEETPGEETTAEDMEEKLAEVNDKYLRLYSEFDNYRKRTLREKAELGKTASADIIVSLLPVIDDMERAIKAFPESGEPDPLRDGVVLIYNKLMTLLSKKGLEPIKTIGEVFNTDDMEAVTTIPAPVPEKAGLVVDEITKGYTLNGKVIRFAKVVVGS